MSSTVFKPAAIVRTHSQEPNWCRKTAIPWPLVQVEEITRIRDADAEVLYRVHRVYEWRRSRPCSPRA